MLRKITRIFFRSAGILLLTLFLFLVFLYFAMQTYGFQTWLGNKAGKYLGKELNTTIHIDRIELEFFRRAHLNGVFILDQHGDTILHGNLLVDIKTFDLKNQKLAFEKITLRQVTSKLIKYKNDSTFNYQFIINYFDSEKKDSTSKQEWAVDFGELFLEDVAFLYRKEKFVRPVDHNINFDNIWLQHTFGKISEVSIAGDTISARITKLRTLEQSGFRLSELTGKLQISGRQLICEGLRLQTPQTFLLGNLRFDYESWDDYQDFIQKVKLNSQIHDSSYVSFKDISPFAKELNGLEETVTLSGIVKGTVSDMHLSKFRLAFGNHTRFVGALTMTGLPDINQTFMHFDARQLSTNYLDIIKIPDYPFSEKKMLVIPPELKRLGTISYTGKFDGFISDFTTYGSFRTGLGNLKTDLSIRRGEGKEEMYYKGKLQTFSFDLGTLLGQEDFNDLSLNCNVEGTGSSLKTMDAELSGKITNLAFRGYNYNDIQLNGAISKKLFNGMLISKDANADFDFNGTIDFNQKLPKMDFISTINRLDLRKLNLTEKKDSGIISAQILINAQGDDIDNLTGLINFDNTIYKTPTRTFKLSTFNIQMDQSTPEKKIHMTSEYLNATAFGQFSFKNLQPAFQAFLYSYYPTFFKKPAYRQKYTDELTFYMRIKKFNTINELFVPDFMVQPNTIVEGNFNAGDNKLNIQVNSPGMKYQNYSIKDMVFIINENNNTVLAELSGSKFSVSDSLNLNNINLAINSNDINSDYKFDWDNLRQPANKGELKGKVSFENKQLRILNEKISVTVKDSTWNLKKPNYLTFDKIGSLLMDTLVITNNEQAISIAGALSDNPKDSLQIVTKNLVLQQFNDFLNIFKLKLEGVMNGKVSLSNLDKTMTYNGTLLMQNLKINDNTIGELLVHANYHTKEKYISLDGFTSLGIKDESGNQVKNISFNGNYYFGKKTESIDISFAAKPANLSLLNPFLTDIITIKHGFVNGEGKIHGSPDNIKIDGKFRLFNSEIKVDYTNVSYNITGDIEIMPDQIRFSDLLMREKGTKSAPQGTINGNVFHTNFKKLQIDYDITYNNMLVLNTTVNQNKTFYGKIYGTGQMGIYGYVTNLHMTINNTTNKNSKFFLPLDGPAEIGDNDFVHFVKRDTINKVKQKALTGFDLYMLVHTTPDAQAQIIIDAQTGDMLTVQGQGDLTLQMNTLGKFEMFGDYIITNGDYLFTLENVINKRFDIEAGSSISWSGNPLGAEIDVTTSYRQRTSVAPLLNDTTEQHKGRVPVDCKLIITGKLFNPNIDFDIDFPSINPTEKARIDNVLSDEVELNRQVFSFLLFRTFVTPQIYNTNSGGVTAGGAAAATGSELLSNRMSEFLNTYFGTLTGIRDLQLGLNYRPGNQTNSDAVDLALSKQFLDNRITVDGNFGVNNNPRTANSNALIGDVNVDYKLSQDGRFRLKGFNKSNDNVTQATLGGYYTQGVGFFYRVEFETFDQLWKMFSKKVKRRDEEK